MSKLYSHSKAKDIKKDILKIAVKTVIMWQDKKVTLADTMSMREPVMSFCFEFFDALEAAEQNMRAREKRNEKYPIEEVLRQAHFRDYDYTVLQDRLRKAHTAILRVIQVNMTEKNRGKFCSLGSFFNTDDFIKRFFNTAEVVGLQETHYEQMQSTPLVQHASCFAFLQ